jgi:hypothetical protein
MPAPLRASMQESPCFRKAPGESLHQSLFGCSVTRVPDLRGHLTLAEVLLDLAQMPDRLLELEDAASTDEKIELLRNWYPSLFTRGREALIRNNLKQIRLVIEADLAASDSHTHRITFVTITF